MSTRERRDATVTLEPVERLLTIGTFARRSRLSPKALRLYDRLGVLRPAHVDEDNGYRRYTEAQLETARLVVLLRRLDMPLSTVAEVLAASEDERAERVASYWDSVEQKIASQRELAAHLRIRLAGDEGSYDMYEILERDVPEQLVLTEQRHVHVQELPGWLGGSIGRLVQTAEAHGGVVAPVFVVFHGEVNEDSDGPVEVCVPVGEDVDGSAHAPGAGAPRGVHADHEGTGRVPADPLRVRGRGRLDPVGGTDAGRLPARGLLRRLGRVRSDGRGLRRRLPGRLTRPHAYANAAARRRSRRRR